MVDKPAYALVIKGKIGNVVLVLLEDLYMRGGGSGGRGEGGSGSTSDRRRYRTVGRSGCTTSSDLAAVMSDDEDAVEAAESAPVTSVACSGGGDKVDAAKSLAWEALPNWWLKTGAREEATRWTQRKAWRGKLCRTGGSRLGAASFPTSL